MYCACKFKIIGFFLPKYVQNNEREKIRETQNIGFGMWLERGGAMPKTSISTFEAELVLHEFSTIPITRTIRIKYVVNVGIHIY